MSLFIHPFEGDFLLNSAIMFGSPFKSFSFSDNPFLSKSVFSDLRKSISMFCFFSATSFFFCSMIVSKIFIAMKLIFVIPRMLYRGQDFPQRHYTPHHIFYNCPCNARPSQRLPILLHFVPRFPRLV